MIRGSGESSGNRDMKKTRPEALFTPSYASGRLLGQAS
jgi:hypothetical protein